LTLVLAQVLLSIVLAVAAAAKLADRDGTRHAARDLGLPAAWGPPIAWGLPAVELALAAALLAPAPVSRVAALAAGALLVAFAALLARGAARGRDIECRCFGRLSAGPAGWPAVARNALLATVAAFVAAGGRAPAAFAAVALAAVAAMVATRSRPAVRAGAAAPALALRDTTGREVALDALPGPRLLVFAGAGCGACHELLPTLARWEREHAGRLSVAVVSDRPLDAADGPVRVLLDPDGAALAAYGIAATPTAVLVGADGRVAAAPAEGAGAIAALVEQAVAAGARDRPAEGQGRQRLAVPPALRAVQLGVVQAGAGPAGRGRLPLHGPPRLLVRLHVLREARPHEAAGRVDVRDPGRGGQDGARHDVRGPGTLGQLPGHDLHGRPAPARPRRLPLPGGRVGRLQHVRRELRHVHVHDRDLVGRGRRLARRRDLHEGDGGHRPAGAGAQRLPGAAVLRRTAAPGRGEGQRTTKRAERTSTPPQSPPSGDVACSTARST